MKNILHFSILSTIFFINIYISQLIFGESNNFPLVTAVAFIINMLIGHYYMKLLFNKESKNNK